MYYIKYKSVLQIEGNLVGTNNGTHGGRKEIVWHLACLAAPLPAQGVLKLTQFSLKCFVMFVVAFYKYSDLS